LQVVFIDRDPEFFVFVLNYLRDGPAVVLPDKEHSRARVQQEAYFYGYCLGRVNKLTPFVQAGRPA
jgi:hypothetical protein